MTSVGVIGGGIAGLTVADELSYRGYEVHVFEQDPALLGGKAASHGFKVGPQWKPLPAEHGFRFFPGFYRNVVKTMEHVPYPAGGWVDDRLVKAEFLRFSFNGPNTGCYLSPLGWKGAGGQLNSSFWGLFEKPTGVTTPNPFEPSDLVYLSALLGAVRTSTRARRLQMEAHSFEDWVLTEFLKGKPMLKPPSASLQKFLLQGGTRMLVAAQGGAMSARTGLVTLARLVDPKVMAKEQVDRLLAGPTNPEWIDPWVKDLRSGRVGRTPVTFHLGRRVTALQLAGGKVTSFTTTPLGTTHAFDHVVLAVPHGVAEQLLAPHQASLPATLSGLGSLVSDWMVGVQYYLPFRPDICKGHVMYVDSPWALTSLTQAQFWQGHDWGATGNGKVVDVLSVCVSNWDEPGVLYGKPARQCTADEIRTEVWHQMASSLNDLNDVDLPLDPGVAEAWSLDPGIGIGTSGVVATNATPLFINTQGSWHHRPPVDPGFANLFLAGDWVRTNADLATMESANEAGRRAANAILRREGDSPNVKVLAADDLGLL